MALEKEKVISKLKEEGIDEKFGEGVNFETEEELNSWVGNAKTLLVKPKALEEYTVDELEGLLKVASPKEKGLQALADRIRDAAKKKVEDKEQETKSPQSEEIKALNDKLDRLLNEREADKKKNTFESTFDKYAKGLEDVDKSYVKATLSNDSSEDDIKKAVGDYKALMTKRGFEGFGPEDTSKGKGKLSEDKDLEASVKRLLERKKNKEK